MFFKRYIMILIHFLGLFFLPLSIFAQYHYKGEKGMEITWGKSDIGYLFKGGYSKYFKDNWYYKGIAFYEFGRPYQTDYHNFGIQAMGCYSFVNINYDAFFNVVGGISANYEYILNLSLDNKSSINAGLIFGIEGEYFVNERIAFVGGGYQYLLLNQRFGNSRWDYGIGLKFMIR